MTEQTSDTMSNVSKHFSKSYIGRADDGKELFGVFLKDGREVRIYVSSSGKSVRLYLDGKEAKVGK